MIKENGGAVMEKKTCVFDDVKIEYSTDAGELLFTQKDIAKLLGIGINKVSELFEQVKENGEMKDDYIRCVREVCQVACRRVAVDMTYYTLDAVKMIAEGEVAERVDRFIKMTK